MGDRPKSDGSRIHEEQRRAIVAKIPSWYRASIHFAVPALIGLGVMLAAVSRLHDVRWTEVLAIPITFLAGFGLEWRAHKMILHRRQPLLGLIYERHELNHHVVYTYDDMTMRSSRELWLILMPAYAIVLVFALVIPFAIGTALVLSTNTALFVVIASMVFFLSYEWMHMAYHLPADSMIGRLSLIRMLREHHRRHHDPRLMKRWNFNVTLPLFDWMYGTTWTADRERALEAVRRDAHPAR